VLAAEPDAFDVDGLREVPDFLRGVDGVGVVGVHDAGVVEHYVDAAPGVEVVDEGFDVSFLGDVADLDWLVGEAKVRKTVFTLMSTLWADGTSWRSFELAFSSAGPEMSAMRTLAPSLAKRIHVSRPIPLFELSKRRQSRATGSSRST
jgi:hypothetical protein